MEVIALYKCDNVVAGDFNIHVERDSEVYSVRLNEIINSFGCVSKYLTFRCNVKAER